MSRLTLDAPAATLAYQVEGVMEVCDTSGRVLGHFVPLVTAEDYANAIPEVSPEELERRGKTGKSRPLKEIIADLEKRG